jgi:hypothetical protein
LPLTVGLRCRNACQGRQRRKTHRKMRKLPMCYFHRSPATTLDGRDKIKEQRLTDKIYVDATRPATLNDGAGLQTDCPTLGEAVTAWQRLSPEQKIRATIKVIGGPVYTACQIDRLHQGPKPA